MESITTVFRTLRHIICARRLDSCLTRGPYWLRPRQYPHCPIFRCYLAANSDSEVPSSILERPLESTSAIGVWEFDVRTPQFTPREKDSKDTRRGLRLTGKSIKKQGIILHGNICWPYMAWIISNLSLVDYTANNVVYETKRDELSSPCAMGFRYAQYNLHQSNNFLLRSISYLGAVMRTGDSR